MKFSSRLILLLSVLVLVAGCDYGKALKTLGSADQVRAELLPVRKSIRTSERKKIISSRSDIQRSAQMIGGPHRDWSLYVVDTPFSPLNLVFSKNGDEFATAELAPGWIIIEFYGRKHLTISAALSKEEYQRFLRFVWRDVQP